MLVLRSLYSARRDLAYISLPGGEGGNVPLLFSSQMVSRRGDEVYLNGYLSVFDSAVKFH